MRSLREVLEAARDSGIAIGHFNISDSTQLNGIVASAQSLNVPVIIGVSEGEKKFIGIHNAVALVQSLQKEGKEVYLNLDHGHSVEDCKEAIDAGFDSVMFDGSKLSWDENIERTKEVVDYAREQEALRQAQGDQNASILVEGELGYIGSSSKMLDAVPSDVESAMTTPEQAKEFVDTTGVDILAPSVGNLHGMLKGMPNPAIDIGRVGEIAAAVPETFLVLHGGSGIQDDNFVSAIAAGMNIVHINTEIRKAYREGIESALQADPEQVAPYKYLDKGRDRMAEVVVGRMSLFAKI
jgi:fructose-bisphosphate aldolase class II